MTHPLDHQGPFSNIPEEITPEEAKRRFRARAEEILRQLDDPEWYTRQMLREARLRSAFINGDWPNLSDEEPNV